MSIYIVYNAIAKSVSVYYYTSTSSNMIHNIIKCQKQLRVESISDQPHDLRVTMYEIVQSFKKLPMPIDILQRYILTVYVFIMCIPEFTQCVQFSR
jgi:hypothetical protein